MNDLIASENHRSVTDPSNMFRPLTLRAMFWRPEHLIGSPTECHIPFQFWLVEALRPRLIAHTGTIDASLYFAHCEAASKLGYDTKCVALTNDAHEHECVTALIAKSDADYPNLSKVIFDSVARAPRLFDDSAIDLLFIDAYENPGALDSLDKWFLKLSSRAVIVIHGTSVQLHSGVAHQFFAKLAAIHPSFEFDHGHGLGVVSYGNEPIELLDHLFSANGEHLARRSVQEVFSRLGKACVDLHLTKALQQKLATLNDDIQIKEKQIQDLRASFDKARSDLSARNKDLTETRNRLSTQVEQHSVERGQLAERANLYKDLRAELKQEIQALNLKLEKTTAELCQLQRDNANVSAQNETWKTRIAEASTETEQLGAKIQQQDSQLVLLKHENASLSTTTTGLAEELANARNLLIQRTQELAAAAETRDKQSRSIDDLREQLTTIALKAEDAEKVIQTQLAEIANMRAANEEASTDRLATQQKFETLSAEKCEMQSALEALQSELQSANTTKAEQAVQLLNYSSELDKLKANNLRLLDELELSRSAHLERTRSEEALANEMQTLQAANSELQKTIAAMVAHDSEQSNATLQLTATIEQLTHRLDASIKHSGDLQAKLEKYKDTNRILTQENSELTPLRAELDMKSTEIEKLKSKLAERFNELAKMTTLFAESEAQQRAVEEQLAESNAAITRAIEVEKEKGISIRQLTAENRKLSLNLSSSQRESAALNAEIIQLKNSLTAQKSEAEDELMRLREIAKQHITQQTEISKCKKVADKAIGDVNRLSVENEAFRTENSAKHVQIKELLSTVEHLGKENFELNEKLKSRFAEIASLTALLQQKQAKSAVVESSTTQPPQPPLVRSRKRTLKNRISEDDVLSAFRDSPYFDEVWYLTQYPDVKSSAFSAAEHYLKHGASEGRNPSANFNTNLYLQQYSDVASSGLNPLAHYIFFGSQENRQIHNAE